MKTRTKIQLLPFEMNLATNTEFILTKNAIIQKIKLFLEDLQICQQKIIEEYSNYLPMEVIMTSPKISKGENYKGLPWLVLDYPRHFEIKNTFALRTMFWWGNFFSITLHLSGRYKNQLQQQIIENYPGLSSNGFYICIGETEWEHHFESDNYGIINEFTKEELQKTIIENSFIKIGKKIPIEQLSNIEMILSENFKTLISLCH